MKELTHLGELQKSGLLASTSKLIPTNILYALFSHDMDALNVLDNPNKILDITSKSIGVVAKRHDPWTLVSGFNPTEAFGIDT